MSWKGDKDHTGYVPKVYDYRSKCDEKVHATAGDSTKYSHALNRKDGGKEWGVDLISFHCTAGSPEKEGVKQFDSTLNLDAWKNGTASSTFIVSGYGDVALVVDLGQRPYTTSTRSVDKRAYTFEIASEPKGDIRMTNYALNAVVETLAWLMKSGKFKGPLLWAGEKLNSNGYPTGPWLAVAGYDKTNMSDYGVNKASSARTFNETTISQQNVVVHRWFGKGGKICPGWYFTERLGYLLDQANKLAGFNTDNYKNDIAQHPKVTSHNTWTYSPINLDFNNIQTAAPLTENEKVSSSRSVIETSVNPTVGVSSDYDSNSVNYGANTVTMLSKTRERPKNSEPTIDDSRKNEFDSLATGLINSSPSLGRNINKSQEMYGPEILKGDQTGKATK